ncbi:TetR family transcriptional regulator [Nonomuraea phyllanthi]|uniref:TetR family transcriptional regulator n=1 Tax=Nonomuraea phyllanthi TaxID=2219224 RepID=A0A5C4WKP2_9ACTN|nr:TetR/AcrR family transcriptional regulator [Nonomuraea phyllanthi]KAB8194881.1 TetR family transcriptional regulator [Nonomuraea phyllanthi]
MPKRTDRTARRQEILDAAVRVFARKGFATSRIEDVAAAAGIAKGTVYLYFDSREALLAAAFEDYAARSAALLTDLGAGPPLERLARLVRGAAEMLAAHPDHARVLLDVWASAPIRTQSATSPLDMARVYSDVRQAVTGLLREAEAQGVLRPGVDERHAAVIVGAIEGCLLQWLVDPRLPLTELADTIADVCVAGVRA